MNAKTYKTIVALSAVFFFLALIVLLFCSEANECRVWVPTGNECNPEPAKAIPDDCAAADHEECAYEIHYLILDEAGKS